MTATINNNTSEPVMLTLTHAEAEALCKAMNRALYPDYAETFKTKDHGRVVFTWDGIRIMHMLDDIGRALKRGA